MNLDTLGKKVGFGYALLVLLLVGAVGLGLWQVRALGRTAEQLIELREPTTQAGMELQNGVNLAAAALRGGLLLPDPRFQAQRQQAWADEIRRPLARLEQLSGDWTDADDLARLSRLRSLIDQLERQQARVAAFAPGERDAAVALLEAEVTPLVFEIRALANAMSDDQRRLLRHDFDRIAAQIGLLSALEWGLLGAGLLLGGLLSLLVTRAITAPLAEAVGVAERIAAGDLESTIAMRGSREVETLGDALVAMRDALQAKTRETERSAWLASGQNRLNDLMRGDQSLEELSTAMVAFLASYTGCHVGALYLWDEERGDLVLCGGYAFAGRPRQTRFKPGEGLIGQAAVDGQPRLLEALEEQQLRVQSSLLDAPPRATLIAPIQANVRTLGVLELGRLTPFSETELEFVRANLESVGIVLNAAVARMKIQTLLEETQSQSEELQQQQEELEQSNEELEEQAQQLKEQQEELQVSNEELAEQARLVAAKNKDLESARTNIELKARQLEISSKYKSEFLANMSHELRTPLNSLLILANDLAHNEPGNLSADQVECAQVISRSGYDLLNLINDILDLSKIEAGRMDLNVASIRIADIAEDIRRTFGAQAAEKQLQLRIAVDELLPPCLQTDKQRLEQILRNLIANALKFTERGSVSVSFERDAGDRVIVAVQDTGIGIPKDQQELIFEAFVQVEGGTARKYGGTGLGLSICRDLAKLLGGSIAVESEAGAGSTFRLILPQRIEPPAAAAKAPPAPAAKASPAPAAEETQFLGYPSIADQREEIDAGDRVVLIIEDDDNFAQTLAIQAQRKGFKHLNAATGEDGLKLAARYRPQAVILDLELPGIDGHQERRELKATPELRHIPVHVISAAEKSLDPIKLGAVDYLTKPVDKSQLDAAFARMEEFISRKMKNLLIVEDNETMRKAMVRLIGNGDVKCWEAATAAQALALLQAQPIDCMVLDIGLPDMNGFELIRTLEADAGQRVPPIIVYTGKELTRAENDELQQYAETIIVKGVKSEERLLDETALFLHRTLSNLPAPKQAMISSLYDPKAQLRGRRILLVDDDMRNLFALSKVLGDGGMEVLKADNGRIALQLLDQHPDLDLVLMDIMMPEMDGYQCMREIRRQARFRALPIVALTAKAMKEDRQKCIDAGANDYISKPVDVERLLSLMRIWISR